MKQLDIKYAGITSAVSDYDCPDGELSIAHNIINENGSVRPVRKPGQVLTLNDSYCVTTVHHTADYRHFIIVKTDTSGSSTTYTLHWFDEDAADYDVEKGKIDNQILSFEYGQKPNHIRTIGNTLVVFTNTDNHYYLWKNGAYKYLGTVIPQVPIQLTVHVQKIQNTGDIYRGVINLTTDLAGSRSASDFTAFHVDDTGKILGPYSNFVFPEEKNQQEITNAVFGVINAGNQQEINGNRFPLPFFARYALRLYDGSYTMQSAPVLLIPQTLPFLYVYWANYEDPAEEKLKDIYFAYSMRSGQLLYRLASDIISQLQDWKDVVKGIDIFASPSLYFYDNNGTISFFTRYSEETTGFFFEEAHHINYFNHGMVSYGGDWVNALEILNTNDPVDWKVTTPDSTPSLSGDRFFGAIALPSITKDLMEKRVVNESRFYKIATIGIDDLRKGDNFLEVPMKEGVLKSLTSNTQLPDGYMTTEKVSFKDAFNYNGRMVYFDAKRETRRLYAKACLPFTGLQNNLKLYTQINDDGVWRETHDSTIAGGWSFLPYVFIPDTRVTSIHLKIDNSYKKTFQTLIHPQLNGVYAFIGFKNIYDSLDGDSISNTTSEEYVANEPNKIYVSTVNNPFHINPSGIITLDVARILGIATATKALSQGQFGQFPMYAMTDQGVWALEVGNTGTITARQPVTRDVVIGDGESITQTDNAVLFASKTGLLMLQGGDSNTLTAALDITEDNQQVNLPGLSLGDMQPPTEPFGTFLQGCRIIYDYRHQRIIVYNPSYDYAYTRNIPTGVWTTIDSRIRSHINDYPRALAIEHVSGNNILTDYTDESRIEVAPEVTTEQRTDTHSGTYYYTLSAEYMTQYNALLVTRPIKLQTHNLKTIRVTLNRGDYLNNRYTRTEEWTDKDSQQQAVVHNIPVTYNPHVRTILYGSRDLEHWHVVASSTNGHLRGFSGTPYKYFRIALLMGLQYGESISGCTVQYEEKQINHLR